MREVEISNAKITAQYWNSEHGLSHWIMLSGENWGIGFGGYGLNGRYASAWIEGVMKALELETLSDKTLVGMVIRVKHTGWIGGAIAIGHPIKDLWFEPKAVFEKMMAEDKKNER